MKKTLLLFTMALGAFYVSGQTYNEIGQYDVNGNSEHQQFVPIRFNNAKVHMLFRNEEFIAAGIQPGDRILGIQWNVLTDNTSDTTTYDLYLTDDYVEDTLPHNGLYPTSGTPFPAISPVLVGNQIIDTGVYTGWHSANFTSSFVWDGTDNLIFQVCRTGSVQGMSDVIATYNDTLPSMTSGYNHTCSSTTGYYTKEAKPHVRIITCRNTLDSITVEQCTSYLSPAGKTYSSTGIYYDTLTTASGCDSVIKIDLTIPSPSLSISASGDTLTTMAMQGTYQWFNCANDSLFDGDTLNQFIAPGEGSYAVIIDNGTCKDTSGCKTISHVDPTGVAEGIFGQLRMYPNPANGMVNFERTGTGLSGSRTIEIGVFNQLGQEVNTWMLHQNSKTLTVKLPKGNYIVRTGTPENGYSFERLSVF